MPFRKRDEAKASLAKLTAGNYNFTPDEWFHALQSAARAATSAAYKDEIEKRIDYYYGRFKSYLEAILKKQFESYEDLKLQLQFVNAIKTITDELSVIYNWGAKRELWRDGELIETGGETEDKEVELFNWIMKKAKYDRYMKDTNCMVTLCNNVLLRPYFWGDGNYIRLQAITPNQVDVIQHPDDPSEMIALYYSTSPTEEYLGGNLPDYYDRVVYHYWDKENYRRYVEGNARHAGGLIDIKDNPGGKNPYGVLPFVMFQNAISNEGFWLDTGYDLTNTQDNINVKLTFLNYIIRLQSFSIPLLIGWEKEAGSKEKVVIAPGRPITIPLPNRDEGTPDFRFVTPSPDIEGVKSDINDEYMRLGNTYGLTKNGFEVTESAQSGYALKIKNAALMERRQNEIPYYEDGEEELFTIIKAIWNTHAPTLPSDHEFAGVVFSETTELRVSISEPKYPDSPVESQAKWEFEFANKLSTPLDYIREKYHMSEEEAQEAFDKIKEWNEANAPEPAFEDKFGEEPPNGEKKPFNGIPEKGEKEDEKPKEEK